MAQPSDKWSSEAQTAPDLHEAGPPFDAADADIVVRSSDDYIFRLHRTILSVASVTFRDMFAAQAGAPAPPAATNPNSQSADWHDGLPVVLLTENRSALDFLLRLIYPIDNPIFTTLLEVLEVISLTDKYMVEGLSNTIDFALSGVARTAPDVVWAIAHKRNYNAAATRALFLTLQQPSLAPTTTIDDTKLDLHIIASEVRALQLYRGRCTAAVSREVSNLNWIPRRYSSLSKKESYSGCTCSRYSTYIIRLGKPEERHVVCWLRDYLRSCEEPLRATPHWETIRDVPTYPFLRTVANCPACGEHAYDGVQFLIQSLTSRVESAIKKVRPLCSLSPDWH